MTTGILLILFAGIAKVFEIMFSIIVFMFKYIIIPIFIGGIIICIIWGIINFIDYLTDR